MEEKAPSQPARALAVATMRTARVLAGGAIAPELRRVFLRELPAFPAWILIVLFGGAAAQTGRADGWAWIAASAAIALIRLLVARYALWPRLAARPDASLGMLFISTHLAQAALWVVLLAAPDATGHAGLRTAASMVFAMWLSAACLCGWRTGWLAAMAGWSVAIVATVIALWDSQPAISVPLLVLLPMTAWAGLAPGKPRPPVPARATTIVAVPPSGGSTRRGAQLVMHACTSPMVGVYDGRIFELNKSAEQLLGRTGEQCIGRPVGELLHLDPPSALDAAFSGVERHALVTLKPTEQMEKAAPPVPARIRVGRSGGHVAIAVVALAPRADDELERDPGSQVGTSDAPRMPQLWRPDLLPELPVLIWLIDAAGRVAYAHSSDAQRWGLSVEPQMQPDWASALTFQPGSKEVFGQAVERALGGVPTYDVLNFRTGRSGGRMALRSHFVPFQAPAGEEGKSRRAVMVMDTIASARELLEKERLIASKARYKDLVEASPNLIWACDSSFRFTFVSRRACRDVYDHTVEELLGRPMSALLDPAADQRAALQALVGLCNGRPLRDFEMAHRTKDGRRIAVAMSAVALPAADNRFTGAIGINVDVTALKQREARLAEALRVERTVLDSAGQAIAVVKGGAVARCNDAFLQLLQIPPDQLALSPVADLFAERGHWNEVAGAAERASSKDGAVSRETRVRRAAADGGPDHFVWCQLTLRAVGDGEYVVALADIDQIRRREAHAYHDARHDELTGLPNRRLLSERVRAALATTALRNSGCAILVFDLDGFKPINDQFGHPAGDMVLREIAQRLHTIVRPQDTVARIGGDEFALLMPDCGSTQDVERIAQRILRELAQPLTSSPNLSQARLTASLGVVMAPEHGRDPEWLMRLADRAMYDAKVEGGDRVVFSGSGNDPAAFPDEESRRAS